MKYISICQVKRHLSQHLLLALTSSHALSCLASQSGNRLHIVLVIVTRLTETWQLAVAHCKNYFGFVFFGELGLTALKVCVEVIT